MAPNQFDALNEWIQSMIRGYDPEDGTFRSELWFELEAKKLLVQDKDNDHVE